MEVTMNKHFLFCFLCIVFLFLSIENLLARNQAKTLPVDTLKGPDIGTIVKDFSLQTTDGETFTLSDYKGKIVIFEFVGPT